jgi:probable rRNA maturation factor
MALITFGFNEVSTTLKNRKALKQFIQFIFNNEGIPFAEVSIAFCTDDYVRDINVNYLNHDYNTDIITFFLQSAGKPLIGDIYISVDTVKTNASINNVPFNNELHRVIFHGVLHLCGYKDKSKKDVLVMRAKEDYYLKLYLK